MILAPHEYQSALWQKIEAHYNARLVECRSRLESEVTDSAETAKLRTEIRVIKKLLEMGNPSKK